MAQPLRQLLEAEDWFVLQRCLRQPFFHVLSVPGALVWALLPWTFGVVVAHASSMSCVRVRLDRTAPHLPSAR